MNETLFQRIMNTKVFLIKTMEQIRQNTNIGRSQGWENKMDIHILLLLWIFASHPIYLSSSEFPAFNSFIVIYTFEFSIFDHYYSTFQGQFYSFFTCSFFCSRDLQVAPCGRPTSSAQLSWGWRLAPLKLCPLRHGDTRPQFRVIYLSFLSIPVILTWHPNLI